MAISVAIAAYMQPWRASLEATKTQEDVPETQLLPLRGAECNTQSCRGGEGSSLSSTVATTDNTVTTGRSVAVAAMTVADKSCARAVAANIKPAGVD